MTVQHNIGMEFDVKPGVNTSNTVAQYGLKLEYVLCIIELCTCHEEQHN